MHVGGPPALPQHSPLPAPRPPPHSRHCATQLTHANGDLAAQAEHGDCASLLWAQQAPSCNKRCTAAGS